MFIMLALLWLMSSILFLEILKTNKLYRQVLLGGIGALLGKGIKRPKQVLHLDGMFTSIGHYFTPYGMLIFAIVYSDVICNVRKRNISKLLLLTPIFIMYSMFQVYSEFRVDFRILAIWVVPYVAANILLIYSVQREGRPIIKKRKILTCVFISKLIMFLCQLINFFNSNRINISYFNFS